MKIKALVVLALTLLATAACIVEPYGGGRGYYGEHGGGDYGRPVWRG